MKKTIRTGLIVSMLALIPMVVIALITPEYFSDSAKVPVHWGLNGQPDRFADSSEAATYLWIMPATLLFTSLLICLLPIIEPLRANLEASRKAYLAIWVSVAFLFTFIQAGIAGSMTGYFGADTEMVRYIIALTSVMFIVLGNYLPKTRQSFFLGIRTPWTLTSQTSWAKTHKLGGVLFMIAGLFGLIAAFTINGLALALTLPGFVMSSVLFLTVYSYLVWRKANDRTNDPDYLV